MHMMIKMKTMMFGLAAGGGLALAPGSFAVEEAPLSVAESPAVAAVPAESSEAFGVFTAVNVGTLGAGMDVGYQFNPYFKARLRGAFLGFDYDDSWDGGKADAKLKYNGHNVGVLVDCHPWGGSFHVTAGLTLSGMNAKLDVTNASGDQQIAVGDDVYGFSSDAAIHAKYQWDRVQPYLGIGWSSDGEGDRSWYFSVDLGVNFIGSGDFTIGHSGDIRTGLGAQATSAELERSVRAEGKDFFKIADHLTVYPVVQLGAGYRF